MIKADEIIDKIIDTLKNKSCFDEAKIIKAYPNSPKPTRLNNVYISIGLKNINLEPYQIDYTDKAGELTISADLFCPLKWESKILVELFSRLCSALSKYNIIAINSEGLIADTDTQAYLLKTNITFFDKFEFGGDT